jgi:hypothetical protein
MYKCDICDRDNFKTEGGLRGHKQFAHPAPAAQDDDRGLAPDSELAALAERLERLEGEVLAGGTAQLAQVEVSMAQIEPALHAYLRQHGAHPGICTDEACAPCRSARVEMAQHYGTEGRTSYAGELEAAAEWAGRIGLVEELAGVHRDWLGAGKPVGQRQAQPDADEIEVTA